MSNINFVPGANPDPKDENKADPLHRTVGVYDRPKPSLLSPTLLITMLIIVLLAVGLIAFLLLR